MEKHNLTYGVLSPVKHNGTLYKVGEFVSMSAKDAKSLIGCGVLAEHVEKSGSINEKTVDPQIGSNVNESSKPSDNTDSDTIPPAANVETPSVDGAQSDGTNEDLSGTTTPETAPIVKTLESLLADLPAEGKNKGGDANLIWLSAELGHQVSRKDVDTILATQGGDK
ncbi:MAG: hypothetical protein HRU28_16810 [Rhizobiales bacterium]|nr:hypothetical protein [Hyphomicrobiales bacterium]